MHVVISGIDVPDRMSVFLQHEKAPHRRFCLLVESKSDGRWYWTTCACGNVHVVDNGSSDTRRGAITAAEASVDELDECLNFCASR